MQKKRDKTFQLSKYDRWMLDGQDISAKFHEYRNQCLTVSFV
jgi:hypothetical protein